MIDALAGLRCTSVRRFGHRFADESVSATGPLELAFDDRSVLTLDAKADWTLHMSNQPWTDPYADASEDERGVLARDVGVWHEVATPTSLARLVGQRVSSAEPELNEIGELTGLSIAFETHVVSARVLDGELTVKVHDR